VTGTKSTEFTESCLSRSNFREDEDENVPFSLEELELPSELGLTRCFENKEVTKPEPPGIRRLVVVKRITLTNPERRNTVALLLIDK
jgi:hypothetical protein